MTISSPELQRKKQQRQPETNISSTTTSSNFAPLQMATIQRAQMAPGALSGAEVMSLQRSMGNRSVQRLLAPPAQPNLMVQKKLTVGAANDQYEREADQVASTVMRQIQSPATPAATAKNRQEAEGIEQSAMQSAIPGPSAVQRVTAVTPKNLQRKSEENFIGSEGGDVGAETATTIQRQRGNGQPLEAKTRAKMESAFGADFSGVQVHTNPQADQLNRSMNAQAFTTGNDLFFRQGAYAPGNSAGQKLIAHELTHVVQQNGGQNVQRQTQPAAVQVHGHLPSDRISPKRRMMHLDFVKMKRQDADYKHIIGKALGIKTKKKNPDHGSFGHYWTEIGKLQGDTFTAKESYGWWPKGGVDGASGAITGTVGELNSGGSDTKDPYHNHDAKTAFHPVMSVDPDAESYNDIRDRVTKEIQDFATGFTGSWNWRLGWGKNCQTFQDRLKKKVGLHYKSAKEWLRDPEMVRQHKEKVEREEKQEETRQQAVASVVGLFKVPDNMTTEAYNEITGSNDTERKFQAANGGLRSGGQQVGATGKTAMGRVGSGRVEKMVEYVFDNNVYWMSEVYWEMYFDQRYPENQSTSLSGSESM